MNAATTVCNVSVSVSVSLTLLEPISRAQSKYKSSIRGRRTINPIHLLPRSSPIIETVEAQAPSESESVARRLILLRHAMSSWEDPSLRGTHSLLSTLYYICWKTRTCLFVIVLLFFFFIDHDRPLSKAGEADAVRVSHKLQQLGWIPQLILSRLVRT
jgi:hypothetical protein